jgi:hypothetical protein
MRRRTSYCQAAMTTSSRRGPVLVTHATPASEHALRESDALLSGRPALVLVVWKAGLACEAIALPAGGIGLAPIELRTTMEVEERLYVGGQRAAEQAAQLAIIGDITRGVGRSAACPVVVVSERG